MPRFLLALLVLASDQALVALVLRLGRADVVRDVLLPGLQHYLWWPLVVLGLAYAYRSSASRVANVGLWLATGGFVSNVITFSLRGGFVDYIPAGISYINLADIAITGGCLLWLYAFLSQQKNPEA